MGLFRNIFTLWGAARLEKAAKRFDTAKLRYDKLIEDLGIQNATIRSVSGRVRAAALTTRNRLELARRIIEPPCLVDSDQRHVEQSFELTHNQSSSRVHELARGRSSSGRNLASSATVGLSATLLAWQSAQVLASASTGTAMLGLHGAAASNAGWALFGGGSLATGGGGMALGHLVLPGIGVAVTIGVGAYRSHTQANQTNDLSDKLDSANRHNELTLTRVTSDAKRLREAERRFDVANSTLTQAVREAKWRLRRFGYLSDLFRYLRYKIRGIYYTKEELLYVRGLERAVYNFLSQAWRNN